MMGFADGRTVPPRSGLQQLTLQIVKYLLSGMSAAKNSVFCRAVLSLPAA
ncbi:MAG: hypothetical protein LBL45_06210 [Treponema sp.]|nr:hypothetical protein [Treponema sp.]